MPFDAGVGFAFTGKDAGLSKTARGAASSIDAISGAVDGLGDKFQANLDNVHGFFKELSDKQLDRVEAGLQSIADSASVNQTSLEGMAAAAAKTARPIVASLGLTGAAAKKAKGQIVGLSIGMNVGAEVVGKAVKAMTLYGEEFKAVGLASTKDIVKFGEVSGVEMDKFGSQIADLGRSWGLSKQQLGELVPWIVEAGRSFGYGKEAVASLGDVTKALDENLSKVLLKNGPEAISKFTKGIYGLALVSSKTLGMDFPDAMSSSIETFNKLAGDVGTFQKTFTGLGTEFGPMADKLGLSIGDWDTAFKLVQNDPLEFVKQLRVLMDNMDQGDQKSQFFLQRLKLTLGEDSSMVRFLTDKTVDMDKAMGQLEGVKAGTKSMQDFGKAWGGSGRTMAESLDLMREAQKMRFMAISKDEWKPYMKNLKAGYKSTVDWMKVLASDTEPGGVGTLIKAASMGLRFGPGGAIRMLFPSEEGGKAAGMIDSLSDSLVDFLPHITALGALGFRPAMLAAPFKMAFKPLQLLGGPLAAFSGMLGGLPKMALSVFGPLGILAIAIGSFTILSKKWKGDQESSIEKFFKKELPIMLLRGLSYLLTGKDLEKGEKNMLSKLAGPELWGKVASEGMVAFGDALSFGMEALEIGTDVMVTLATKMADGITKALANADYEKFGESLAKIAVNLTSAVGKIVAKTPDLVVGLAKGIAAALGNIKWGKMFGGVEKEVAGASAGVGDAMKAGFGLENVLGAGALIGLPLVLGGIKKIRKDSGSMLGALGKKATKAPAGVLAGIPECVPTCGMGGGAGGGAGMLPGPISGPGAVMQPQASKLSKAMGWKGMTGMGAGAGVVGGLAGGAALGGAALAGKDLGAAEVGMGIGGAALTGGMMGGVGGAAVAAGLAASMLAMGEAIDKFNKHFEEGMKRMEGDAKEYTTKAGVVVSSGWVGAARGVDKALLGIFSKSAIALINWKGQMELTEEDFWKASALGFEKLFYRTKMTALETYTAVKESLGNIIDGVKQGVVGAYNLGKSVGELMVMWVQEKFPRIADAISGLIGRVKDFAVGVGNTISGIYAKGAEMVSWILGKVKWFWEEGKLIGMKAGLEFKRIYYGIHDMIDGLVIKSLTIFQKVIQAFWEPFSALPSTVRDAMVKAVPAFGDFLKFIETTSTGIDKTVAKSIQDSTNELIKRNQDLSNSMMNVAVQTGKVAEATVGSLTESTSALDKQKGKVGEYFDEMLGGWKKAAGGAAGVISAGPMVLTAAFQDAEGKKQWYEAMGAGGAADLAKQEAKGLAYYKEAGAKMVADATPITEKMAEEQAKNSQNVAMATLALFSKGQLGIKKEQKLSALKDQAATTLKAMAAAKTPEEAASLMEKAVVEYKGKGTEKAALAQMLAASGSALFSGGALEGMAGQKKDVLAKAGIEFAGALAEKQVSILESLPADVAKKAGKGKKTKVEQAKETAEAIKAIGAGMAEAMAPASLSVGGKTYTAPAPPAAKIMGPGGKTGISTGGMGPVAVNVTVEQTPPKNWTWKQYQPGSEVYTHV